MDSFYHFVLFMCGVSIHSNWNDTKSYLWNISNGIVDIKDMQHKHIFLNHETVLLYVLFYNS